MPRSLYLLLGLTALPACKAPSDVAPTEMSELAAFLFRHFEDEDTRPLIDGIGNMEVLLSEVDLTADITKRSWQLTPLVEDDLAGLTVPDRPRDVLGSLALATASAFGTADHATHMIESDLVPVGFEADVWERTFPEGDPACFPAGSCEFLRTDNHSELSNTWVDIQWDSKVDYRWVELDDGRMAILSRGWFEDSASGNAGANNIWQRYEVDVLAPLEEGAHHFYGTWSEAEFAVVSDDFIWQQNLKTAVAVFEGQETWLEGRVGGQP
jgi:hypothetical protein